MPTILRINGYQFYFYAEEGNEPFIVEKWNEFFRP